MSRLAGYGVNIDVPAGWEAELYTQPDPSTLDAAEEPLSAPLVVLHAANFALPARRGDYGSDALKVMDRNGIFTALVEFNRASANSKLFARRGVPARLRAADFSPTQLHEALPPQAGLQHFFTVGARPFCLYSVIGSYSMRGLLVPELNRTLSGLSIA